MPQHDMTNHCATSLEACSHQLSAIMACCSASHTSASPLSVFQAADVCVMKYCVHRNEELLPS
jgi:hypothetical protein